VSTSKRYKIIFELVLFSIIPIVLLLLPSDYFDSGETVCLSVRLFDMECWGCGLTRAIMHLIHLEFVEAYYFNPLSFIVFPFISIFVLIRMIKHVKTLRKQTQS
jgi:hypothetical protein